MNSLNMDIIKEFFENNFNTGIKWDVVSTISRCEGFTIAYGAFFTINYVGDEDDDENVEEEKKFEEKNRFIEKLANKYPELTVSRLPCCWPAETGYDVFIGFTIYPLLWTGRRYFIDNGKLLSAQDDWICFGNHKTKLLKDLAQYPQYDLPLHIKDLTDSIHDNYTSLPSWEDCLYLKNYGLDELESLFKTLYAPKIEIFKEKIKDLTEFDLQNITYEFCMLPTDCAACS